MAQWIEVKVRYDKMTESGKTVKVTDPYLVDAVSCTEAEARVVEEISSFVNDFNVLNVGKTKISEIFWDETGDRFYKVKVNFITIDEKSGVEKRKASFILVQASTFTDALANFNKGMKGTMADYEIEAIAETKIVDVYRYQAPAAEPAKVAERVAADKGVQRAVKKFRDAVPEGMKVSMSASLSDGTVIPETVVVDKSIPHDDDD
ncbi:DUF4494 domain-containing protein [uncultured Muribaculum sp.]|uniref:DUF4494 domain-containing protein n=1 Tax=uncultured Muribaculum sp. TaxID=1918613 RepID=UPI00259C6B0B|nr:DUF4494 domain-containing protein [uncultured Muribaculum sp.]